MNGKRSDPTRSDGKRYYKVVQRDGGPTHGGSGLWPLPTDTAPGMWREVEGPLEPCRNGLHVTTFEHLSSWVREDLVIYRAEVEGEIVSAENKYVARKVRLLPGPIEGRAFLDAWDVSRSGVKPRPEPSRLVAMYDQLPRGHVLQAKATAAREAYAKAWERWDKARTRAIRAAQRKAFALLGE